MKHLFRIPKTFLFSLLFLFFASSISYALQAIRLQSNGIIELDNHQKIRLAGILPDAEALKSISVMLSHKELHLEEEKKLSDKLDPQVRYYYVHVNAREMNLPFKPAESAKETTLMVNEVLLSLGLAKVDQEADFKQKAHFQQLEVQAKQKGRGVWSYEPLSRASKP